jgi:hypothetical protein
MVLDEWPVIAEDFNQWVVEDNFCCGCPDWDKVYTLLKLLVHSSLFTALTSSNVVTLALQQLLMCYPNDCHYCSCCKCNNIATVAAVITAAIA